MRVERQEEIGTLRSRVAELEHLLNQVHTEDAELKTTIEAIVHASDDAILRLDLNGVVRSWNPGAERIFGYTAEEFFGRHVFLLSPSDRADEIHTILASVARGEPVEHYETRRLTKAGTIVPVLLTVSPLRGTLGAVTGASWLARDLTDRDQNQTALWATNEALRRANLDLEQFSYAAAHDMQEPLRMVSVFTELLRERYKDTLDAKAEEFIGYVVQGALRIEMLMRDLLVYSRVTEAAAGFAEAAEAVMAAQENLKTVIAETETKISWNELPQVRLSSPMLQQVFENLIANAIKYRSTSAPVVRIEAEKRDQNWLFSVRDNGIGIEPGYCEQIFGLFKRLHTAAEYPGTGIGLAICHKIVEHCGGRIWVESTPGAGSVFRFTVPC